MKLFRIFVVLTWASRMLVPVCLGADGDRVRLGHEHVDLEARYDPAGTPELSLVIQDRDTGTTYSPTNVVLVVREAAETTIPPGFEIFGEPGSPFWLLSASQDPGLLYLGLAAGGVPAGVVEDPVRLLLREVRSAGWFFMWQFDPGGTLQMRMDSRNGIGPDDRMDLAPGSHAHVNWGFSSNGVCEVTFQLEGRRAGSVTNLTSVPTPVLFEVEPVPAPPETPAVLSNVRLEQGWLKCDLLGEPGVTYQLETSANLNHWTRGSTLVAASEPVPVQVRVNDPQIPLYLRALSP